ncbi:DNA-binding transcriptional MerR regulator [Elusimicrobium posterum]|uniref:MerR family transcriptional regulator n=1 Tax=Elusimicrobium posterum TaxID=3116653 RepID=UPI003C78E024
MGIEEIETKDYFSIGDVTRICGVPEHSLRYWEAEFNLIRPVRKESGHRRYRKEDLYTILKLKDLIYHQKMTLEGAKKALSRGNANYGSSKNSETSSTVGKSEKVLKEIYETLSQIVKE